MISATLPGEALAQLGQLGQLSHLYPPAAPGGMTPEFLAPPPRPIARYPRRRDPMAAPSAQTPAFSSYSPYLHPASYAPYSLYRPRVPPQMPPSNYNTLRTASRQGSGFVPPAPAPHSPPVSTPTPSPLPRDEPPTSPEGSSAEAYFCKGALIQLEDGTRRRVEDIRIEDFVTSADKRGEHTLTQSTLLRVEERGDQLTLTFTYDRNRTQVDIESRVDHPYFVYGSGWASYRPERTLQRYGLPVQRLQVGDVCVTLVKNKYASAQSTTASTTPVTSVPASTPPQIHPENLSVREDAPKRRKLSARRH